MISIPKELKRVLHPELSDRRGIDLKRLVSRANAPSVRAGMLSARFVPASFAREERFAAHFCDIRACDLRSHEFA
jgi:hypothetical protein